MNAVKRYGYLLDMDGVIYRGNDLIPGADRFVQHLINTDTPFLFLTNNSQRTRRDVVTKLARLGIDVEERHIFTCAIGNCQVSVSTETGRDGVCDW